MLTLEKYVSVNKQGKNIEFERSKKEEKAIGKASQYNVDAEKTYVRWWCDCLLAKILFCFSQ